MFLRMIFYRRWIVLFWLAVAAVWGARNNGFAGEELAPQSAGKRANGQVQEQAQALSPSQSQSAAIEPSDAVANAVVKVFSTIRLPDPYKPWTKRSPTEVTGSGVVLSGKR